MSHQTATNDDARSPSRDHLATFVACVLMISIGFIAGAIFIVALRVV